MLTARQIATIIQVEFVGSKPNEDTYEIFARAAEKIAAFTDDNGATVAAAALENEVTSTLMDMLAATCLATLIEEEGRGRANIAYSPMSMDHMMKHYIYEVRNEGMIRHVSIKLREDSNLRDEEEWRKPSNRHGVMHQDESIEGARPQAEPKAHDRPIWAVRFWCATGDGFRAELKECVDREDAERVVRGYHDDDGRPDATIENRYCMHTDCPSTGCNQSEATST